MADISSALIEEFKVSTDETTANYVELADYTIGTFRLNRGRQTTVRTGGRDRTVRNFPVKPNPSMSQGFRPDTSATGAWGVLSGGNPRRAFTVKVGTLRVTGIAVLEDQDLDYETATAVGNFPMNFTSGGGDGWVFAHDGG